MSHGNVAREVNFQIRELLGTFRASFVLGYASWLSARLQCWGTLAQACAHHEVATGGERARAALLQGAPVRQDGRRPRRKLPVHLRGPLRGGRRRRRAQRVERLRAERTARMLIHNRAEDDSRSPRTDVPTEHTPEPGYPSTDPGYPSTEPGYPSTEPGSAATTPA
eukprot:1181703-Prorocentrum_minimum.AAC.1